MLAIVVVALLAGLFWLRRGGEPRSSPPPLSQLPPPRDAAMGEIHSPNPSAGAVPSTLEPPMRTAAPEKLLTRPASEWQGMLVDLSIRPYCEKSEQCGKARACRHNECVNCLADADCAQGESCVLDQCVVQSLVTCRRAADCRGDEKCVLSGYSPDPRGNTGTRAFCQSSRGGSAPVDPGLRAGEYQAPPVRVDDLTDQLHKDAAPQ